MHTEIVWSEFEAHLHKFVNSMVIGSWLFLYHYHQGKKVKSQNICSDDTKVKAQLWSL